MLKIVIFSSFLLHFCIGATLTNCKIDPKYSRIEKKFCASEDSEFCVSLKENLETLCQDGIKGKSYQVKDEEMCLRLGQENSKLKDSCSQFCQNSTELCLTLLETYQLKRAPLLGENGHGIFKPALLGENGHGILKTTTQVANQTSKPIELTEEPVKIVEATTKGAELQKEIEEKLKSEDLNQNSFDKVVSLEDHMKDEEALETQSQFFSYFVFLTIIGILGFVAYQNKKKIIALVLEGRRKNSSNRSGRRTSSAQYRVLDNNLEEAMADQGEDSVRHVIY